MPIQFLFDVVGYKSFDWLWLWVWTAGHFAAVAVAIALRYLVVDPIQRRSPNPFLNIAVGGLLGITRVTLIGYLSFIWELQDLFDLGARIYGGLALGTVLFAFLTNLLESGRSYRESLRQLLRTQNRLERIRKVTKESLASEQIRVEKQARRVIEPKLQEIATALMSRQMVPSTKKVLAQEITQLLEQEVRPLNASLRETSKALADQRLFRRSNRWNLYRLPDLMRPHLAIRPPLSLLVFFITIPFALYVLEDETWISPGQFIAVMCAVLVYMLKNVISKLPPISVWPATLILFFVSVTPVALVYFMLSRNNFPLVDMPGVLLVVAFVSISGTVGYALIEIHKYNRETFLEQVKSDNLRIERELALINQKMWVQRRSWALALHGTVQASLTAALVRLQNSSTLGPKEVAEIKKHISQARSGLLPKVKSDFDFTKAMKELRNTWKGIIDVSVDTKSPAAVRLAKDTWASMCANEIIKEAVSNAMRHGKAKLAVVSFQMLPGGFIEIKVVNNGRPVPNTIDQGLGSQLLDEITHQWSLVQEEQGAVLRAKIPISKRTSTRGQSMSRRREVTKPVTAKTAP